MSPVVPKRFRGRKERKENGVSVVSLTAKVCMVCFSLFVPFASFAVHGIQRECPLEFSPRNVRKPRKFVCLLFLVRTVRFVRSSRNSKGVSVVILTAKHAKIANKKGSVPCRLKAVRGRVQGEGFPSTLGWNREL